ncbi:uncharacterized protein LOC109847839 [Asparagus officinalis]|uniref:uncharacterized protein LOC109847839 n=1 Tax=Asparagus officinalis TaxID=4686 RepID=UPI00098DEBAE|nr:uncharacterized protein LOC109847839 [Asparagus officinalis]
MKDTFVISSSYSVILFPASFTKVPASARDPTPTQAVRYLHTHVLPHPYHRAILHNNTVVGSISITPCSDEGNKCRASVGYRLAHDYWGKGIATVAVRMAVAEVFERWEGLERVEGVVDVENNVRSMRVLEKAGFLREGVLRRYLVLKGEVRDVVMFGLVRADLLQG